MIIRRMKTCHVENPLGFYMEKPVFSWVTDGTESKKQISARVEVSTDENFSNLIHDSGVSSDISSLAYTPDIELKPRTRYFWRVTVNGDLGDSAVSETAWFETSKMDEPWEAKWISPEWEDYSVHPYIRKGFELKDNIKEARIYATGIGLYQLEINGKRVSDEFLTPHYNAYYQWLQYQTYDVTDLLTSGNNGISAMLGNGWVKGRFGFRGADALHQGPFNLLVEMRITYADGSEQVIVTDDTWKCSPSPVLKSSIYDGEEYDSNLEITGVSEGSYNDSEWSKTHYVEHDLGKLTPRLSLPLVVKEIIKPVEFIRTPAGELVLDMGQNMVGWVRFKADFPAGTKVSIYHSEVLQQGNFYTENLRTAKQEYHYISNGTPAVVQPNFTFYGFRYIKLEGWPTEPNISDFEGCVVYSDIEHTGHIETSDPLVNRLFLNALWGQKGNFVDVPTDCPQRDERMGWTGDAQVFSGTASFNMDCYAFYTKYLYDMYMEQLVADGSVSGTIPTDGMGKRLESDFGGGACAWADAATVIPWNVYLFSGDKDILERQYKSMKAWVDWVERQGVDVANSGGWLGSFHFGDWLALDGEGGSNPKGGTEDAFLAAAYYVYSTSLTAKAATVLGKTEEAAKYSAISEKIKQDMVDEYFSKGGRGTLSNQTFYVVSLFMDIVPEQHKKKFMKAFVRVLEKDNFHLKTGFIGTPILCRVLSDNGRSDIAYKLLLNDDLPSWLYAVKLGATTIWERWNSLNPDGSISDTGMNSLNHYSYGSIVEWMYRNMCGINPVEDTPGFKRTIIRPEPNGHFTFAKAEVETAAGLYKSGWELKEDGTICVSIEVPFDAEAELTLPRATISNTQGINKLEAKETAAGVVLTLPSGKYNFEYTPTVSFLPHFDLDTPIVDILDHAKGKEVLLKHLPQLSNPMAMSFIKRSSINDLLDSPISGGQAGNINLEQLTSDLAEIKS